ncbi:MAG: hypothetical protein JWM11_1739 [Planctomycetaceae bacterium]|nr:hypothetical protein [Planctomycetaceae bacterium]
MASPNGLCRERFRNADFHLAKVAKPLGIGPKTEQTVRISHEIGYGIEAAKVAKPWASVQERIKPPQSLARLATEIGEWRLVDHRPA